MPMMRLYSLAAPFLLFLSAAAAQSGTSVAFNDLAKKAEAGDVEAQVQLGRAYEEGNGVSQSDESAVRWYRKICRTGQCQCGKQSGSHVRAGARSSAGQRRGSSLVQESGEAG